MNEGQRLSFGEFLSNLRGVVVCPGRRFPVIHERGVLWGSLFLLIAPAYFPMAYLGGILFGREPFPGYSLIPPLIGAVVTVVVKLFGIHLVARLFEGRWHYRAATGRFRDLVVVSGYAGVPSIMAAICALVLFVGFPDTVGILFRDFRAITISVLVAVGIALFVWNLILSVLALRTVYPIRDFKIVISVLIGPFIVAIPLVGFSLVAAPAHINSAMVAPILNEKVVRLISTDPESQDPEHNKVSYHVDLLVYRFRSPRLFELVAYSPQPGMKGSGSGKTERGAMFSGIHLWFSGELKNQLAGRIAGLPGDEVELDRGRLRINGRYWQENYLVPASRCEVSYPRTRLGPSEYFILPEDRHLVDTYRDQLVVERGRITGRLILNYLPLGWWLFRPTAFQSAVPAN